MSTKKHYTDLEKRFFLQIVKKFALIIEKKKSDITTLKDKEEAWNKICELYNASSLISVKRNVQQLKKFWSNLKSTQRDAITKEKQARLATGGGPEPTSAEIDPDIAEITPHLMATAPVVFSSNMSLEMLKDRQEIIVDETLTPEQLIEESKDDNDFINDNEELVNSDKENIENISSDTFSTDSISTHAIKQVDNIVMSLRKKRKKMRTTCDNNNESILKVERLERIMHEEELAKLKYNHELQKQKMEIKHLTEKYALEIRAATATAELSEFLFKEKKK